MFSTGQIPKLADDMYHIEEDDLYLIPTGEVRPGIRSAKVWQADVRRVSAFGWLNYTVLVLYLAALVWLGIFFSRRDL